jgi:hypothetical protein
MFHAQQEIPHLPSPSTMTHGSLPALEPLLRLIRIFEYRSGRRWQSMLNVVQKRVSTISTVLRTLPGSKSKEAMIDDSPRLEISSAA